MTPEEQKQELLNQIKGIVSKELETRASKEDMQGLLTTEMKKFEGIELDALRSMMKSETGVMAILEKQGLVLAELQQKGNEPKDLSVRSQIQKWQDDNKDVLAKIKEGTACELPPLQIRAAATMTVAGSLGSSAYLPNPERMPGIVDLVRVQPTFWSRLKKGATRANPFYWVNKTNKQGNATFIGEGVIKNLASFELSTETSVPKKVAERMKASTEILYDVEGLETYMMEELRYEVEMAANTAVLTGTASSTSPAGITTIASAFSLTTVETINPTTVDAIRACIAQLRSLNFNGVLTAYMNPIDMANMDLEKATDSGVYMLPPFTNADNTVVKGVQIIEDNNITVGNILIGDMDKYKILMHQDFFIKWGWENDDFSKNLVTVIGEMRFHQFYSTNHTGAWIYDAIADIKTAITASEVINP